MIKQRLAIAVAAAALMASTAFGYGVEGWPNGRPDHVIKAEKDSNKPTATAEGCSCCKTAKKDRSSTNDERNRFDDIPQNGCADGVSCN